MYVNTYRTHKILPKENLLSILDTYLPKLEEKSIVVVTSKIISLCQGDVLKNDGTMTKRDLIKQEADWYLPESTISKYGVNLTITRNTVIFSAGIDESNADGNFVFWPRNLQIATNIIWQHLKKKHNLKQVGVIVTDSHLIPMRTGVTGFGMSWCGFKPLNSYVGKPDIFGKKLQFTHTSVVDGLSAAAVALMGEGKEQTPLAVIQDLPSVKFVERTPTKNEIAAMNIPIEEDLYAPLLTAVQWIRGKPKAH